MSIELTPLAAQEIRQLLSEQPERGKGPDEQQVRQALHEVIDPEVGINIVDLGLVYGAQTDGRRVRITMTMTTPACPLSEQIKRDINERIFERCPGVERVEVDIERVEVDIVWNPFWEPEKMSESAKEALGWSR